MYHHKDLHIIVCCKDDYKEQTLVSVLQELGVGMISVVDDAESAASAAEEKKKNLLIVADQTSIGTAKKTLLTMREQQILKNIPTILFTEKKDPEYIRSIVEQGISAVIQEPIDVAGIATLLRNYLRKSNTQEVARLVRQASFFAEFTTEDLQKLAKAAICRHFSAGDTIICPNDPSDRFYVLLKGEVEAFISKEQGSLRLPITAGNSFGEIGPLEGKPRSAWCIAVNDCYVLEIGSHILTDKEYDLRLKILTQISFVLARRILSMNNLIHKNPTLQKEQALQEEPIAKEKANTSAPVSTQTNNPFAKPTAQADTILEQITTQEEYDVLQRKINLRTEFITNKLPRQLSDIIANKMHGYWTGGKLSTVNPHKLWPNKWFTEGTAQLKQSLHLVVLADQGEKAYKDSYLQLPFTHRVIGLSQIGCTGTFLANPDAIRCYFDKQRLKTAIKGDLEIPIDRLNHEQECIEFLTHTAKDVRENTLFLVFDDPKGENTALVRKHFPAHQMITVVKGYDWTEECPDTIFTQPAERLAEGGHLIEKEQWSAQNSRNGFYTGQTFFLPDLSLYFAKTDSLKEWGYLFATIGLLAQIGPNYSGVCWGSKGGAEGAVKAARARFGITGAQSPQDLADAINWADG